jgi:hypothetical protein
VVSSVHPIPQTGQLAPADVEPLGSSTPVLHFGQKPTTRRRWSRTQVCPARDAERRRAAFRRSDETGEDQLLGAVAERARWDLDPPGREPGRLESFRDAHLVRLFRPA